MQKTDPRMRTYGHALKASLNAAEECAKLRDFANLIAGMTTSAEYEPTDPDDHRQTLDMTIFAARRLLRYPADFKPDIPGEDDDEEEEADGSACIVDGLILGVGDSAEEAEEAEEDARGSEFDPSEVLEHADYVAISQEAIDIYRQGYGPKAFVFVAVNNGTVRIIPAKGFRK